MRGFVTGLSLLGIVALVGLMTGCGPSKQPCQCAQQSGCHCPLPPPPPKETTPPVPPAPAGGQSRIVQHAQPLPHRHVAHHAASHRRYATRASKYRRAHAQASALPYDYRSQSRSYWSGERSDERDTDYDSRWESYGRNGYGHHRRYSQRGGKWDYSEDYAQEAPDYAGNGYGEGSYDEGPDASYDPETAAGPMSINRPAALDPWNGYGADCPDAEDRD